MNKVEEKANRVYEYICNYITTNSYPPTVREICSALSISSTSLVYSYIDRLIEQGRLEKQGNKNRAIGLVDRTMLMHKCPLVGTVSAGTGILAVENIEDYYDIPHQIFKGDNTFLLRVSGNSMINAGISNGDLVVIQQQNYALNNQIILARFDGQAVIKRFFRKESRIILHPENDSMQDIILDQTNDIEILGIVIGCIKTF
ncbi:MAG: transcriptional repressor LexA [Clostridia bacterium]|nr:transcriptional repressor LexA [Clostridia bacterium]